MEEKIQVKLETIPSLFQDADKFWKALNFIQSRLQARLDSLEKNDGTGEIPLSDLHYNRLMQIFKDEVFVAGMPLIFLFQNNHDNLIFNPNDKSIFVGNTLADTSGTMAEKKQLLENLTIEFEPRFGSEFLSMATVKVRDAHFRYQTIVPHSGILSWLHYFSPAAIGQYRLERLFENPYLRVTGVGEGHLFEVLEDPFEIHTPEGEAKVIAANRWMLDHPN